MGDSGSPDIFVEEPLHRTATLDIHFRSHDGFHLALELSRGKRFLGVLDDEGFQECHEARIGIWSVRLAHHLTKHVHDPCTLPVDHFIVSGSRLGGVEAQAHDEGSGIGSGEIFASIFGQETLAFMLQPGVESAVRILDGIGKKQREIVGDGFVDPLIAITGPANDIPPPLVRSFMKGNNLAKEFLAVRVEASAPLGFGRKEGVSGNVEESRPALPEGAGNLRDPEVTKREGAGI